MRPSEVPGGALQTTLHEAASETHSAVSEVPFETRAPSVVNNRAEGKADHATLLKLLNLHQYVV